jgi:hypothetical protein
VLDGEHLLRGLRNIDIRKRLFGPDPRHDNERRRRSAAVGRLLKRLHVRGLLAKIPHSRRWHLTQQGRHLLAAAVQTYQCHFPQNFLARAA